jgi:hypothetical protein
MLYDVHVAPSFARARIGSLDRLTIAEWQAGLLAARGEPDPGTRRRAGAAACP